MGRRCACFLRRGIVIFFEILRNYILHSVSVHLRYNMDRNPDYITSYGRDGQKLRVRRNHEKMSAPRLVHRAKGMG